jgi:hypothetical protein
MDNLFGRSIAAAVTSALLSTVSSEIAAAEGPVTGKAETFAISIPARDVPPAKGGPKVQAPPRINPLAGEADGGKRGTWTRAKPAIDPLVRRSQNRAGRTPDLDLSFEGTGNPLACGGCSPPDTVGDVGLKHFIQMVNATKVAIFRKKNGNLATPVFDLGDLFSTNPCTNNAGDPVVLYDDIADRWLLSQFQFPSQLCFAISQTSDPLGSYFLYQFDVGSFPDYFKVGVWPNGYYVSANESTYTAYAFDRSKMLAGDPTASFIKFTGETNFLLPADVDGSSTPGGGGLFYTFKDDSFHGGGDRIELFELVPDFVTPGNSTFGVINTFPVTSFTYTVCGFFNFDCIPQKNTGQRVDAVSEWPMHRFAYRRNGSKQSLVGNFTVGGGTGSAGAAIRWFELRKSAGTWTLFQEGTHDLDDGLDRFMGSIAMDAGGNIALGYSASSSSRFPSIRYATRAPKDPLGTLGPEKVLQKGRGSQTGSNRWGDYSAMTVDPVGDCQFWYTNEYYNPSSATTWRTRVGAFTVIPPLWTAKDCK